MILVAAVCLGAGYVRIASSPLFLPGLKERIAEGIAARIGPGWVVDLKRTAIELDEGGGLAVRAVGLDIRNPEGALVVRAPFALVGVDPLSIVFRGLQPRSIDFRDLQLRATLSRDGSLAFATSPDMAPTVVPAQRPVTDAGAPDASMISPLSGAVASLFGAILNPSGIVGALDRARLTNARLSLVDEAGHERAVYSRMDARFERGRGGAGRFEMRLEGAQGPWRVTGDLREDAAEDRRGGVITVADMPVIDALLLSGLSHVPASTDLKISARTEASLRGNSLQRLEIRSHTSSGTIELNDKDFSPIPVERATVEASWDESRRALKIRRAAFEAGDIKVPLEGELTLSAAGAAGPSWTLDLAGRDAQLNGPGPGDGPVKIDRIQARLSARNSGAALDALTLAGPGLDAALEGTFGTEMDRGGFTVRLVGTGVQARPALRLWPEGIAKSARGYLVEHLRGGVADKLTMDYALSGPELEVATQGGLIPDDALRLDLAVRDGELVAAEGLPPLSGGAVTGVITGRTTTIQQTAGEVRLPDGRALAVVGGTLTAGIAAPRQSSGKVSFRLVGGADAAVSLLQNPTLRAVASVDLNPALVKGRVDLRVDFPLPFDGAPEGLKSLALGVSGTAGDLTIDKAFGRDRLEGGNLAIAYDANGLAVRGDARVAGAPASIDLRQGPGGVGEAVVSLVLDDAARAKKGLSFASQLTGPLPMRVTIPLGAGTAKPPRPGARVEADLTKATVDNLIPGWTKPAGRAGKLAFTINEGTDIRDIVLESGPVSARGSATFTPEGTLERADLTTLKISAGDDMRAQVDRSGGGYKVAVRGNVADARPILRSLTAPNGAGSSGAARERDGQALDLDFGINILTGFHEEVLTNAILKASLQGREVRQLSLQGRFRSAPVTVQVARRDRGAPALTLTSEDAGATLRFLDIYRRMVGGKLQFAANLTEPSQTGIVTIDTFGLRDEPALRNIAQQSQAALPEDGARGNLSGLKSGEVSFTSLKANLTRSGTRVDFSDAVIWGMQVGFTLSGWVDVAKDRADVNGTFVPAYGLNNVFAQVPLFGPLLGGGQHEGLFAVNFKVSGLLSAPTLTVNPLSAVAPGFLRKIFGFIPQGGDVPTGSAANTAAPKSRR